jgi:hypothetical protein
MKFQGINQEFHIQVVSLLFYTPENSFKMLNKQTNQPTNKQRYRLLRVLKKLLSFRERYVGYKNANLC